MSTAAALLLAYLVGSVPFALLLARRWGAGDLHEVGSGNIGAANVFRVSGPRAGVLVAALDIAKGAASVLLAERFVGGNGAAVAAVAAVVGHVYPVWLRFRGGKGVATACGAFVILTPIAMAVAAGIFVMVVWMTRFVSLGSVIASASLPPLAFALGSPAEAGLAAVASAALIVFRHRSNLARMRLGLERRFGVRVS
jgi:glycerol-3-phosphate acyltransferase PlsY